MDSGQLGQIIDRYAAALELYARQWCDAPEDVVQETFIQLACLGKPPDNPAAWLFRVAHNSALNAAKAALRRRRHEAQAMSSSAAWFRVDDHMTTAGSLDPDMVSEELRTLPLEQREVIVAHIWGGLTFEQIGSVSGCSSSTAHRLYCAGLTTIRERLGVACRGSRPIPD